MINQSQRNAPDPRTVAEHLDGDINACEQLIRLMKAERQAVQSRATDELGAIIEEKALHLNHLEQSARTRSGWAQQAQNADAESAWHQFLETLREPALKDQWEKLKVLTTECQTQNEVNGKMLARSQQTFNRLLNIMRGQTEVPNLYNQSGGQTTGRSSHNFGEA